MADHTRELIAQASQGDAAALTRLLEEHLPKLRAFVRLRVGPVIRARETRSDIVQSVCREVLKDLARFEYQGEASFAKWLFGAALHKILERQRYHARQMRDVRREQPLEDDLLACYETITTPSQVAIRKEQLQLFEETFDKLPEHYREVLTLSKIVGLGHAEIAQEMGKEEAAVRMLLHRAMAKLGVLLDQAGAF